MTPQNAKWVDDSRAVGVSDVCVRPPSDAPAPGRTRAPAARRRVGHASVTITYDLYGHLMPGNEGEAADRLDTYLERAQTDAEMAEIPA